ncbi:uncharacterized protein JCM10292_002172 [Rhodotorula paludigena]|uniref:uncharacterized protein n=1 Tax=Rhodotorula paludigena TaxID=86838 RepID=UPI00317A4AC5
MRASTALTIAAPAVLLVCRYQYLKLVLRVELERFDVSGMFRYDATNVPGLRNLPSLVLSPEQRGHLSERGIVLDIPPPDSPPVYLPALPASSETCRVLLSVLQYNGYGTVQELIAAAKKRLGPVQGNEADWECSEWQVDSLSKG